VESDRWGRGKITFEWQARGFFTGRGGESMQSEKRHRMERVRAGPRLSELTKSR